jgi:hypothetical protein
MLLEGALDPGSSPVESLGRSGAWRTPGVKSLTTVALLRLRFKLIVRGRGQRMLLAEEAAMFAWDAASPAVLIGEAARLLLDEPATADLAPAARQRLVTKAIEQMPSVLEGTIAAYAGERAQVLVQDHARVRAAATGSARVNVEPVLPPDAIGLYVLIPAGH